VPLGMDRGDTLRILYAPSWSPHGEGRSSEAHSGCVVKPDSDTLKLDADDTRIPQSQRDEPVGLLPPPTRGAVRLRSAVCPRALRERRGQRGVRAAR
jgi:hypothetical protein